MSQLPLNDFLVDQPVLPLNAGDTFAWAGTITGLDTAVAWGLAVAFVTYDGRVQVGASQGVGPNITVTMTKATDFATSGAWNMTMLATGDVSATWGVAVAGATQLLQGDLKFYDTANPDPVLHTGALYVAVSPPVTP